MNNEEILNELNRLSDKKYKEFHSSLCPNSSEIMGVRVPDLRNLAKEITKTTDIEEYLKTASDNTYEERLLQGMVLGLWKSDINLIYKYLVDFLPKIDSWAICDITASGLKMTKKNMEFMWQFINDCLESKKEFTIRFGIVLMLDYYITEEYIDEVLKIVNDVNSDAYYVKMAVAWTIQVAFVKFPDKTMKLLEKNRIDDWTYNKALQKITESYRIDDKTKEKIRKMKR